MGNRKEHKHKLKNPSRPKTLAPNLANTKKISKKKKKKHNNNGKPQSVKKENDEMVSGSHPASASDQLKFFLDQFQSAKGLQLSSLELESLNGTPFNLLAVSDSHEPLI